MRFNISNGEAPFTYTLTSDSNCIVIENPTGVAQYDQDTLQWYIESDVWGTEDCIYDAEITLTVTDNNGCVTQHNVIATDYCVDYGLTLSNTDLSFTATPIGFVPDTYIWHSSTDSLVGNSTSDTIYYQTSGIPVNTVITCTAIKGNCIVVKQIYWIPPSIVALPLSVQGNCNDFQFDGSCPNQIKVAFGNFDVTSSVPIVWDTLEIGPLPTGVCFSQVGAYSTFMLSTNVDIPIVTTTYKVKNIYGNYSNTATLVVNFPDCPSFAGIFANDYTVENIGNTVITVNLDTKITNGTPDWTTLAFSPLAGQTLSGNTLTTPNGVAVFSGTSIKYTQTVLTQELLDIRWNIKDVDGTKSNLANLIINTIAYPAITAVNDSQCGSCGSLISVPIFSNDSGSILSATITSVDPGISALISGGALKVQIGSDVITNKSVKYKLLSTNYTWSNEATVTITPSCAGRPVNSQICSQTVNLYNSISNYNTGGTWTQVSGTVVTVGLGTAVVLSTPGNYTFRYTTAGLCPSISLVTIVVQAPSTNDYCTNASVINFTSGINYEGTFNIKTCDTVDTTINTVIDPPITSSWNTQTNRDVWFAIVPSTTATFGITIDANGLVGGIAMPQIAIYRGGDLINPCASFGSGGLAEISNASSTTRIVSAGVVGPTAGIPYHVRVSTRNNSTGKFKLKIT